MDINDYGKQFQPALDLIDKIENIINQIDTTATEDDWQGVYGQIIGSFSSVDLETTKEAMTVARDEKTYEGKTRKVLEVMKSHYSNMDAMVSETASILGSFGVGGITFV